ncbi:MAG: hypothetical protein ACE5G0_14825 [Rhodothermales bacterium]
MKGRSYYKAWIALFLLCCVGAASSCGEGKVAGPATVVFEDLDGETYFLTDEKGRRFYPLNLSEEYHFNGLRVYVEAVIKPDTVVAPANGIPVEILDIRPLLLSSRGAVQYVDSLGGFYGIVDESGREYRPINLDALFKLDRLPVRFEARIRPDSSTSPGWGVPIELVDLAPATTEEEQVSVGLVQATGEGDDDSAPAFVIVDREGRRLVPTNLPLSFQRDQLQVRFGYAAAPPDSTGDAEVGRIRLHYIERVASETEFAGRGLLRFVDLEDGFFGLVDEDGRRYQPRQLDEAFRQDGLLVRFWAVPDSSEISTQMWGTPLDIIHMDFEDPGLRYHHGVITYLDLEGGFYGVVGEGGVHYRPLDLPEAFQQDGLPVRFLFAPRTGMAGIQMWGTPVELLVIEAQE